MFCASHWADVAIANYCKNEWKCQQICSYNDEYLALTEFNKEKKKHFTLQSAGFFVCVLLFAVNFRSFFIMVFECLCVERLWAVQQAQFYQFSLSFSLFCFVLFKRVESMVRKQIDCSIIYRYFLETVMEICSCFRFSKHLSSVVNLNVGVFNELYWFF